MLFHVREHQMILSEVAVFIRDNDIEFLGFICDPGLIRRFGARFPQADAASDLGLWQDFETGNPGAFAGMYQFWVRKNG
jgi:hypothetical protein